MTVRPVLFEDHTLDRFRPLAWSVPLPELRCGLFSLRERVDLVQGGGGLAAVRAELAPLLRAPGWRSLAAGGEPVRSLWLSGRLAPSVDLVAALLAAAAGGDFALTDEAGLVALACGPELAAAAAASWLSWAEDNGTSGDPKRRPAPWPAPLPADWTARSLDDGLTWRRPADGAADPVAPLPPPLGWVWDIVPRTAAALTGDLAAVEGRTWTRHPYGLKRAAAEAEPLWARPSQLAGASAAVRAAVTVRGDHELWLGPDADLTPGTVIDARRGPVILDRGVAVGAHVFLEGPLYIGPGSLVKPGAVIHGESSFGVGNRLAGEIGESTFGDFTNKQHDGFVGHAVLGSWINLGALTTCSDLKNNYGPVRVDLGWGAVETGLRFVGLLMGDHAKTAIGTLFNTGTSVGFAANVFGDGMPPKCIASFSWGGRPSGPRYDVDKAVATAAVVMSRRGCVLDADHERLFRTLAAS